MKLNKKGFVLAETLIVTVFVMVIFTVIYLNYYPILGKYNQREYYDDVDSKYYTYWLKRFIQDDDIIDQSHWNKIITNINAVGGYELKCVEPVNDDNNCLDVTPNYRSFFARYLEETGNKRIFISKYNLESTIHTNGQDSSVDATFQVLYGNSNKTDTLIPQFKGSAKITYLTLITAKEGESAYTTRKTIESKDMKICFDDTANNRFYLQNGQFERPVVELNDAGSTEKAQKYTVDNFIKSCIYQAQNPTGSKKPRCAIKGSTYYDKTGTASSANYNSQCPSLINNALTSAPTLPNLKYEFLKKTDEVIDKDSQLVDYINYLPAFKFPSTKGANYRVIAEYQRKITPGVSGENSYINTYSNIEIKR